MSDKHAARDARGTTIPDTGIEYLDFNTGLTCQSQCCEEGTTAAFALVKATALGLKMIREAFEDHPAPTSWLSCERSALMGADAGYVTLVQEIRSRCP